MAVAPPVTPVPGTPAGLRGLTNLHGTVVPVLDSDPEAPGERRHLVVLNSRRVGRFALACDWVQDLAAPADDATALDIEQLGRDVIAGFDAIEQRLPRAEAPTARIVRRSGLAEDAESG